MKLSDLHFSEGDLVDVDGHEGYVNVICIATSSHLHPQKPMSYFTLTVKGTERTPRAVNICIPEMSWSEVKVIRCHKCLEGGQLS